MSRIAPLESARSGRPLVAKHHLSRSPGSVTPPLHHRKSASSGALRKGKAAASHSSHSPLRASHPPLAFSDLSDEDAGSHSDGTASDYNPHSTNTSRRYHGLKLGVPKRSTVTYPTPNAHKMKGTNERRESGAGTSSTAAAVRRKAEQRQKPERKATVRKDRYELDGGESDSDLSDVPSEADNEEAAAQAGMLSTSTARGADASAAGGGDASDSELDSASDPEMEAKLRAAGDGESLLGSAASDRDDENTADEEERYIIQRATRKAARRQTLSKVGGSGASLGRGRDHGRNGTGRGCVSDQRRSVRSGEEGTGRDVGDDGMADDEPGDRSGGGTGPRRSLSPETMRQLGLDDFEDELFAPQSAFGSASEPSFTDFFASDSDSDDHLSAHDDDAELTSDGTDSDEMSDIVASAALMGSPLIAQIGADAGVAGGAAADAPVALAPGQEIPLLVIEDLDGRLIYARAGDGEAVFGSDGEFEIIDESEDEMTSEDDDVHARSAPWGSWRARGDGLDSAIAADEGETTDELADEEMPFPRLLVGSVAPRGGRNTRRARAMAAAKSRQRLGASTSLAPGGHRRSISDQSVSQASDTGVALTTASAVASDSGSAGVVGNVNPFEVDFTVSTEALARDPAGTIATAAQQLGITEAAAAELLAGVQVPGQNGSSQSQSQAGPSSQASSSMDAVPATPVKEAVKPEMGSFMPTSAKSVHRAVIDGSKQAPSPFANRHGMQKRGLAGLRKRQLSGRRDSSSTQSSKRPRRLSAGAAGATSARDEASEAPSSPEAVRIDPMDIDDVVNASMLWRSSSFSASGGSAAEEDETDEDVDMDGASTAGASATTETVHRTARASSRASSTTAPSATGSATDGPGLNLNAFARWDRIPMGAFRDGQGSSSSARQPLGTFLLTRSQRSGNGSARPGARGGGEHSPFRGGGRSSEGAGIHMGAAPRVPPPESPLANAGANEGTEALDAAQARRRAAFFVSPILWPVRGDGEAGGLAMAEVPPLQLAGPSAGAGGNGMMTKREKRERRARRAARRAVAAADALAGGDGSEGGRSPAPPTTPRLGEQSPLDSPATALPRLSITDASPCGSPAPARLNPGPSNLGPSPSLGPVSGSSNLSALDAEVAHPLPPTSQAGLTPPFLAAGSAPSAVPSSACGLPLYSPLFGGIASPSNLGFHDDLDEHEANEGPLAI